jgi:hypothetical protein
LGLEEEFMKDTNAGKDVLCKRVEMDEPIAEQRMWTAVLLQAVEDWKSLNLRARREAERFLFHSDKDFEIVCAGARIDSSSFRARLSRVRLPSVTSGNFRTPLAA